MNHLESRREFLKRIPRRLIAGLVMPELFLTNCSSQPTPEATTTAEREMAQALAIYQIVKEYPEVNGISSVTLSNLSLCNQRQTGPVLERYDGLKKPYKSLFGNYEIAAVMASVDFTAKVRLSITDVLKTYEEAKRHFSPLGDDQTSGQLTALALSREREIDSVLKLYDKTHETLLGSLYSAEPTVILASATLSKNSDWVKQAFDKVQQNRFYWESATAAGLVIAGILDERLNGGNISKTLDIYDVVRNLGHSEAWGIAMTLAVIANKNNLNDTLEMHNFAVKSGLDEGTAARLTLAAIAAENDVPLISTVTSRTRSAGKVTYTDNCFVPILLG